MSDERFFARAEEAAMAVENLLDPGAGERREGEDRARARRLAQRKAFLIATMQNPEGRVWLKELLAEFHAFEARFATVPGERTFFFAGEQRCGWHLWQMLDAADPVVASRLRRDDALNL